MMKVLHHRYSWGGHAFVLIAERWRPWMAHVNARSLWLTGSLFGYARLELMILDRPAIAAMGWDQEGPA